MSLGGAITRLIAEYGEKGVLCQVRDITRQQDQHAYSVLEPVCADLFWLDWSLLGMDEKDVKTLGRLVQRHGAAAVVGALQKKSRDEDISEQLAEVVEALSTEGEADEDDDDDEEQEDDEDDDDDVETVD